MASIVSFMQEINIFQEMLEFYSVAVAKHFPGNTGRTLQPEFPSLALQILPQLSKLGETSVGFSERQEYMRFDKEIMGLLVY